MIFWKRPHGPEQLRASSDEALCREVSKGNHDAFLVLFDKYWKAAFKVTYAVLRNKAETEDLVQSLFLEVHTTMLGYDERRGSFRTLLLRYAFTRAVDHRRYLESQRYYAVKVIEELADEPLVRDDVLAGGLYIEEGMRLIEQGLEHLDDKQRAVVTAYFFRGLPLNEIAIELGESFGNVRHFLYRGLDKLRRVLAPNPETSESSECDRPVTMRLHRRLTKRVAPEVSVVRARSI
jgi:RNA polymerase sigma-70 factor (ECF subfamily)